QHRRGADPVGPDRGDVGTAGAGEDDPAQRAAAAAACVDPALARLYRAEGTGLEPGGERGAAPAWRVVHRAAPKPALTVASKMRERRGRNARSIIERSPSFQRERS